MAYRIGGCLVLAVLLLFGATPPGRVAAEQSALPAGFQRVLYTSGLTEPTVFAFEGQRIFVAERAGKVRIIQADGTLRPEPYVTLNIWEKNRRGIYGLAVDPKYSKNRSIYVFYTTGPGAKDYSGKPMNRVSRFKTKNGIGVKEKILLDNIPTDPGYHNGGDLHFGFDNKLYVSTGVGDAFRTDAVRLDNLRGKILRLNRDGSAPTDNPYYNKPNADKRIFARGFRNPFRLAPRASNSTIIVGDVGEAAWEELDSLKARGNYGWARYEGPCPYVMPDCDSAQTDFAGTTAPIHAYRHAGGGENGGAIIAGAFPHNSNYPAPFTDALFYGDWGVGWVHVLALDEANREIARYDFDTVDSPVAFATGPDGNIYVADYGNGNIYKYVYTP